MGRLRTRLAATGVVLVAAAVGGCGGGEPGAERQTPSVKEFCSALQQFRDDLDAADPNELAAYVETLKAAADEVDAVGLPGDIPSAAEEGFDLTLERIRDLPADATQDDVATLGDVGEDDQPKLDALQDYITESCPGLAT